MPLFGRSLDCESALGPGFRQGSISLVHLVDGRGRLRWNVWWGGGGWAWEVP